MGRSGSEQVERGEEEEEERRRDKESSIQCTMRQRNGTSKRSM
jgi:hypothetical protein